MHWNSTMGTWMWSILTKRRIKNKTCKGWGGEGIFLLSHVRLFCKVETQKLTTTRLSEYDILGATSVVLQAQMHKKLLAARAPPWTPLGAHDASQTRPPSAPRFSRHRRSTYGPPMLSLGPPLAPSHQKSWSRHRVRKVYYSISIRDRSSMKFDQTKRFMRQMAREIWINELWMR
jgi:hypothetical protein